MLLLAGEHMDEFENFDTKAFVGRLLGKGDWTGFMDKIKVSLLCPNSVGSKSDMSFASPC